MKVEEVDRRGDSRVCGTGLRPTEARRRRYFRWRKSISHTDRFENSN